MAATVSVVQNFTRKWADCWMVPKTAVPYARTSVASCMTPVHRRARLPRHWLLLQRRAAASDSSFAILWLTFSLHAASGADFLMEIQGHCGQTAIFLGFSRRVSRSHFADWDDQPRFTGLAMSAIPAQPHRSRSPSGRKMPPIREPHRGFSRARQSSFCRCPPQEWAGDHSSCPSLSLRGNGWSTFLLAQSL